MTIIKTQMNNDLLHVCYSNLTLFDNFVFSSGDALSPTSEPRSLTESMQQMDDILSDTNMDRLDKMERLEALLTAAMSGLGNSGKGGGTCCSCQCHDQSTTVNTSSQTLSTGDIVITRVFVNEEDKEKERTIMCSSLKH